MNEMRSLAGIDETALLRRTAHYARRIAPCLCNSDPARGATCDWYHGFWPTLRLLGVSTNAKHSPLFEAGFERTAHNGGLKRLLIAGGADNALLVQFLGACRRIGCDPDITFVDRCATPVALNRWTARKLGASLTSAVAPLVDFRAEEPFDVICCHNLLIFVDPAQRADLLSHWSTMLRPGGRLLMISNIRPDPVRDREEHARQRAERLKQRIFESHIHAAFDLSIDELRLRAERFALNMNNQHIARDEDFAALINPREWNVAALEFGALGVVRGEPSAAGDATSARRYAWLEAMRR